MKPVLSSEESARLDSESTTQVATLMERAGVAVATEAARMGAGYGKRVVVLAGPGNNGGDGYVAAKHLRARGAAVQVLALAPPKTDVARAAADAARAAHVPIGPISEPGSPPDLIIDALFGGGFRGGVPDAIEPWIELGVPVLAVDMPSGVDPDTGQVAGAAFRADLTVSFHSLKPGHLLGAGPDHAGEIEVVDIGLIGGEPTLFMVEESDARRPRHERTDHKWSAGSVLVMGGSSGMVGAAVMAARSALHFGAGAVGVSSTAVETVQLLAPEVLAYAADTIPDRYQVVIVGPGLGHAPEVVSAGLSAGRPLVIDADALALIPEGHRFASPTVLTPHSGEFERLSGAEPGPDAARSLAERLGAVVVLKGNPTIVTDGGVPRVIITGGPELATIGTGDVLAGMIGALMARGLGASEAACAGAYWHGVAGDDLRRTTAVTADSLATHVGRYAWAQR